MKKLILLSLVLISLPKAHAQNFSASIGTDVPYQHYVGLNLELKNIDISYRTGILIPPYSDAILQILEEVGTDQVYVNLLDAAYDFGWMNSIGVYYKFGASKNWYLGTEFRIDYLTASDTPDEIIEAVSGQRINRNNFVNRNSELKLSLNTFALGLRLGRRFPLGSHDRHFLSTELSVSKHVATQSYLQGNGNNIQLINEEIDRLLWDEVFKKYGYIGGLGVAYSYKF